MNWAYSSILVALLLANLASAGVPNCILKVTVLSPPKWYSASPVSPSNTNMNFSVRVENLSSGAILGPPIRVDLIMDNGSLANIPNYDVGASAYWTTFRESRKGVHSFGANTSESGCIGDSAIQYYYYNDAALQGIPDFSILLLPLVAIFAVAAARTQGGLRKKQAK